VGGIVGLKRAAADGPPREHRPGLAVPSNFAFRSSRRFSFAKPTQVLTVSAHAVHKNRSWPGAAKSGGRTEGGGVGSQEGGTGAAAMWDDHGASKVSAAVPSRTKAGL
jgi:hypothetical protein